MQVKLSLALLAFVPLLAATSPAPIPTSSVSHIPISRKRSFQNDGVANIDALNAHLSAIKENVARGFDNFKANTGKVHPNDNGVRPDPTEHRPAKRATSEIGLKEDFDGDLWFGAVSVGTPLQNFTVRFQTGSSDFFLPGPNCGRSCQGHTIFQTGNSSTAVDKHREYTSTFANGARVIAEVFKDTVSVGGLVATEQTVGVATAYTAGFQIANFQPDGVLGMGFQSITFSGDPPVVQTLVSQNQTSPVFGFTFLDDGGEVVIGGRDTTAFIGDLAFTPVTITTPPAFWQISVTAVSVGTARPVASVQSAIVDTATAPIVVDPKSAAAIHAAIPGAQNATSTLGQGLYTIPCDEIPNNVALTVAGQSFTLSPEALNFGQVSNGSTDCVSGITAVNLGVWVLGTIFLRNVYSEYDIDNLRVGFAPVGKQ